MACFIVPLTQAVVTTVVRKRTKNNHNNPIPEQSSPTRSPIPEQSSPTRSPWTDQLPKLELMLWGGSLMLVVDHIINGELTWQYPFFTAMEQKDGIITMLQEMLCVGVPMSAVISLVYVCMVVLSYRKSASNRK